MPYVVDFNEFSSEDEKEYENFALTVYKDIIDSSPDILTRIDNSRWELTMESIFDIWEQFPKNFAPKDTVCKKKLLKYLEKYYASLPLKPVTHQFHHSDHPPLYCHI